MDTNTWLESGGGYLRDALKMEARKWHFLHQPPMAMEAWEAYRCDLLAKLKALAGTFPERAPLNVEEHGEIGLDGYKIIKLTYQSRSELRVTANLYVPDGKGPFPAVLNVHGHWPQGKISPRVAAVGHALAKVGIVALSVDAFGSGERCTEPGEFEYHGGQIGASLMSIGETLLGMQVYDNMRGIDLLQGLDFVDPERIGVTGASGGGNQTMWVSAFDGRVKAAVPVVSVGTFESYVTNPNCICEVFPMGLTFMEEWAVLALMAPKPLLIVNSLQDGPTFNVQEMIRSFNGARQIYRLYGFEERIAYKAIDLPHGYWPEMRSHMIGWFKRWLKDEGWGLPHSVPDIPELPEADLMCFPGKARPPEIRSIIEYATLIGRKQKAAVRGQYEKLDAQQVRQSLRMLLRIPPAPKPIVLGPVAIGAENGCSMEKFSVESAPGILIPCQYWCPAGGSGGVTVLAVHGKGKGALLDMACFHNLLREGKSVCIADLRNIGETRWDLGRVRVDHEPARAALWLGRTMVGEWVADLMALRAALGNARSSERFEILAIGEPDIAALAATALTEDIEKVTLSGLLATCALDNAAPTHGMGLFVPGMLKWGDVSLMAALAQCPLMVSALVKPDGRALADEEIKAWEAEVREFADRLGTSPQMDVRIEELA